jgi:hypothetical protein
MQNSFGSADIPGSVKGQSCRSDSLFVKREYARLYNNAARLVATAIFASPFLKEKGCLEPRIEDESAT